jgi:L,D-transpeptidase ErfK/SrfK
MTLPIDLSAVELIQREIEYRVVPGDYGMVVSGKLGVEWPYIAMTNSLNPRAPLKTGQVLRVSFMRIVPELIENGIVINIPDRTLYRFENGRVKDFYFIAAGKPTWQTPLGDFSIIGKAKDPTWFVPPSIQKEMEEEGKEVLVEVPPGPENPLGKYWIQLSIGGIGIHGTIAPQSIYRFRSHGCMRLRPEVAELLFKEVPLGTKGKIIYRPVKVMKTSRGRVLLEIYKDFYRKGIDYREEVKKGLSELNAANEVDWNQIEEAITKKDGIVRDVSRKENDA